MQSSELNQWLEQQQALWKRALADFSVAETADWQPLFDAAEQIGRTANDTIQSELARQLVEQLRDFCRLGLEWLRISRSGQSHSATQLLLTLAEQLNQQTAAALLRQWQLPQALSQWLSLQQPQGSPLQAAAALLQQFPAILQDERTSHLTTSLMAFHQALFAYQNRLQRLNMDVAAKLVEQQQAQPAEQLITLYDCWVNLYEERYRAMLLDPTYSQCYGELINSSLRLQKATHSYWTPLLKQLGATPYSDHQALLKAHHQTKKELRNLNRERVQQRERLDRLEQQLLQLEEPHAGTRARRRLRKA